jgi:hypothetical protein
MKIQSDTGFPFGAEVDEDNNLHTRSSTVPESSDVSQLKGLSFEFASGAFLTLANDTNEHAVFYIKNTSTTHEMHIINARTCNTEICKWLLYKNDTGGTLISDVNAGIEVNHNFNSGNVAEADVWQASGSGKTRSGGSIFSQWINGAGHSNVDYQGALVLGTNNSLTFTCTADVAAATIEACVRVHAIYVPKKN